jgi:hypothetical protein
VSLQQKAVTSGGPKSALRHHPGDSNMYTKENEHDILKKGQLLQEQIIGNRHGFEQEAKALQEELAEMQRSLKDRMQRYNKLSTFQMPT